jgi:hypothetical protein
MATNAEQATTKRTTASTARTSHRAKAIISIQHHSAPWTLLKKGGTLPNRPYLLRSQSELRSMKCT